MKLYGLIGYPLGHSFSREYFTEKFKKEGLADCVFEAFPISTISQFSALLTSHPHLKGLSVTIPYKEQVLSFVQELSPEVKSIGATNSIKITDGRLIAYNTDITGFEKTFIQHLQPYHTRALVMGTGGASKAVQYVLRKLKIDFLVVTRNKNGKANLITYHDVDDTVLAGHKIIINCTPAGMFPNENTAPAIPYQFLTSRHYLYDLVYKPSQTLFLQKGAAAGAIVQNGYEMLLVQAEASWDLWNSP